MTYEDTKKEMMTNYPSLFVDEADVLHHLFAVNGNGYHWADGELVDQCPEDPVYREARRQMHNDDIRAMMKRFSDAGDTEAVQRFEDLIDTGDPEIERAKEVASRAKRAAKGEIYDSKLYPLCEYADILHIPDDVKPDWFEAAQKACKLFGSGRYKITEEDEKWLLKAAQRINNLLAERYNES